MGFLSALLFAFAVSLDGFGVGVSYGVRRIRIPVFSLLIICLSSAIAITLSMLFGGVISRFFDPIVGQRIGAVIILLVGIYLVFQALHSTAGHSKKTKETKRIKLEIFQIGIVIEILRRPVTADIDKSGTINALEALLLGFALAMDALGAGFGAAVAGFKVWLTPLLVAGCKLLMVSSGLALGKNLGAFKLGKSIHILPGLILILIGLFNF